MMREEVKTALRLALAVAVMTGCFSMGPDKASAGEGARAPAHAVVRPPPVRSALLADPFFGPWRTRLIEVTLPSQWEQLEAHYHLHNFRVVSGVEDGVHLGPLFLDSDLYKWLEAASLALRIAPGDDDLRGRVDEVTSLIQAAQMDDGYLNTYYQSFAPDQRWEILFTNHELYCAGHLIEAACASYEATGDTRLLEVARGFADHIVVEFGEGANPGMPGHEEIELALVRLYRVTGDERYLDQAAHFVRERGADRGFRRELIRDLMEQSTIARHVNRTRKPYLEEAGTEADTSFGFAPIKPVDALRSLSNFYSGRYFQVDRPLVETRAAEGHAVRAMYLYAGAADVYLETGDERLLGALSEIWENTTSRRAYITGGMGSFALTEGFGKDYELPNQSYTETCASIAGFFFSWRMLMATGEARYADWMERALYNSVLSGISLDGRHYFYQNPLTASGDRERQPWYVVACCPPNIARVLASIERYAFGESDDGVWLHLLVGGEAVFDRPEGKLKLSVESGLPWEGKLKIKVHPARPTRTTLYIRRPEWAEHVSLLVNGEYLEDKSEPGTYMDIHREWNGGDVVEVEITMSPRLVEAHPKVRGNRGKVALAFGPLVYCIEDVDNPGVDVHKAVIAAEPELSMEDGPDELLGARVIVGRLKGGGEFTAVPFYAWGNRGKSHMEVWVKRDEDINRR